MAKRNSRPFRLENGFGSIVKLSGHRRCPFAAKTATQEYTDKGYPVRQTLGYFATWQEAYECLLEYNKKPYDIDTKKQTFTDVYNQLIARRTASPKGLSDSNRYCLQSAYKICSALHKMPLSSIKTTTLQSQLDSLVDTYKHATLENIKNLWSQMWKLAEELDIVDKNYASFVAINKTNDDEHSVAFTSEEIQTMWDNVDTVPYIDAVLVMIYSGYRVSAYKELKVDLENGYFQGGVKTQAGKNRIVPIHNRIRYLVVRLLERQELFNEKHYDIRSKYKLAISACGIDIKKHTPHDTRATFTSLLQQANVKDIIIDRLIGHKSNDLTKDVYTTVYIEQLREAVNSIL